MSEYLNITTARGKAVWPALTKPDSKYGNYKTDLELSDEDGEALLEKFREHFVDNFGPKRLSKAIFPLKKNEEGDGYILKAKSQNKPKLFDRKGNPIKREPNIGGGSTLKLGIAAKVYDRDGKCGVTVYLNEVQLIELREYQRGSAFKEEEGDYEAEDDSGNDSGPGGEDPPPFDPDPVADEDIDF